MTGKWSQPGVPHKGWICIEIEDLGALDAICEMCEVQEIRYAHHMEHPAYPESLRVGCVCAAKMEDDYDRPLKRERALKNAAQRRHRWLSRKWRTSVRGNSFLNTDGMNIAVFQRRPGVWGGRITDRITESELISKRRYVTEETAKLAAFDTMIFLKEERGWGS